MFKDKYKETIKREREFFLFSGHFKKLEWLIEWKIFWGLEIDDVLGNNLGRTFKTFDNFDETTKTVTGVKSIDMDLKTYWSGAGLESTLNKNLKAIGNFTELFPR